jgi:hypothetical protein
MQIVRQPHCCLRDGTAFSSRRPAGTDADAADVPCQDLAQARLGLAGAKKGRPVRPAAGLGFDDQLPGCAMENGRW